MKHPKIEVVRRDGDLVGESPMWHREEKALYWVDARKPSIQKIDQSGRLTVWPLPKRIGTFAFRRAGGLIGAMEDGFHELILGDGPSGPTVERRLIANPDADKPDNRMNDGKTDAAGRFWCGSRSGDGIAASGSIFRLLPDGSCTAVDTGFIVPNGMAFSPDNKRMLVADSRADAIYQYDFDLAAGKISNRRVFFSTAYMPARIDGAAFDSDGGYWCALVYDWSVARFDADGRLDRLIRLPVQHPTMCCFGGPNLDTLYITSGAALPTEEERAAQPLAGALFAVHGLGVTGVPEPRFAG